MRNLVMLSLSSLLILLPGSVSALQLQWGSGALALSSGTAVRCTLVVTATPPATKLPSEWRVVWNAAGTGETPRWIAAQAPGAGPAAEVVEISPPLTAADSASHIVTAGLEAAGLAPQMARYVVDLPGSMSAKFKVIALDSADPDSEAVLSSNTVTYNGGLTPALPPVILRAGHRHNSTDLHITLVGNGLSRIAQPTLRTQALSHPLPLRVLSASENMLEAEGTLPDALEAAQVELGSSEGTILQPVPSDSIVGASPQSVTSVYYVDPDPNVVPHDFAFIYNRVPIGGNVWKSLFHLIYTTTYRTANPSNQTVFRHAWTSRPDVPSSWRPQAGPSVTYTKGQAAWDFQQIYAPSLITDGAGGYRMFYTGLNANGEESIGFTTTALLDTTNTTWSTPVLVLRPNPQPPLPDPRVPAWVQPTTSNYKAAMRDPFVVEDPDNPGLLLMYYVAGNKDAFVPPAAGGPFWLNAVGVVRSGPDITQAWTDLGYFRRTDDKHQGTLYPNDESPHVFPDFAHSEPGTQSGALWRLMFTDGPAPANRSIRYTIATQSVSDTTLENWTSPVGKLYDYLQPDNTVFGWEATEYLHAGTADFMAAYDGVGIQISRMVWTGTDFSLVAPSVSTGGLRPGETGVTMRVLAVRPSAGEVRLELQLPEETPCSLDIYDVAGRRVARVMAGALPRGRSVVAWNCRDRAGLGVKSGIYFARLTSALGVAGVRLPLVR